MDKDNCVINKYHINYITFLTDFRSVILNPNNSMHKFNLFNNKNTKKVDQSIVVLR